MHLSQPQTLNLDGSRFDRIGPDSISFNQYGASLATSFNNIKYVPNYVITGTGPGFAITDTAFGVFTDFIVGDFAGRRL